MTVGNCAVTSIQANDAKCMPVDVLKEKYPGQYRKVCNNIMPPTRTLTYSNNLYINNKWDMSNAALCDQVACDPLYLIDVSHVYHFSHSQIDDDVEAEMSKGRLSKGDRTPSGNMKMYTGAPYYRGFANTSDLNSKGVV